MRRTLLGGVAVLILLVVAVVGWRANVLNIRGAVSGSVAAAFDDPPASPGYTWSKDGRAVSRSELATFGGPDHCGWQSATFLMIGWPPGTLADTASKARQYVRDPRGSVVVYQGRAFRELLGRNVALPSDAKPTGYKLGAIELYLSPSDEDRWIYVASPRDAERWPRSDPMTACM